MLDNASISKYGRDEASAIFRKSRTDPKITKAYVDNLMNLFTAANTTYASNETDKAKEYNKILAQFYYNEQMRNVEGIDETAMKRFTIDGSSKAGAAMTDSEKTTFGIEAANTLQL